MSLYTHHEVYLNMKTTLPLIVYCGYRLLPSGAGDPRPEDLTSATMRAYTLLPIKEEYEQKAHRLYTKDLVEDSTSSEIWIDFNHPRPTGVDFEIDANELGEILQELLGYPPGEVPDATLAQMTARLSTLSVYSSDYLDFNAGERLLAPLQEVADYLGDLRQQGIAFQLDHLRRADPEDDYLRHVWHLVVTYPA